MTDTDIAAAWPLVESMKERGELGFVLRFHPAKHGRAAHWSAGPLGIGDDGGPELYPHDEGTGETAAQAIRRAAARATPGDGAE